MYLLGGPMMGNFGQPDQAGDEDHQRHYRAVRESSAGAEKQSRFSIDVARAASICCQCQTCTDLCPRYNLGHPIRPHLFMRAAANRDFRDLEPFLDTMFCCSCGLCELYSCPQGLRRGA